MPVRDSSAFKATQLIAPATLIGSGLMVHYLGHETVDAGVRDFVQAVRDGREVVPFDDYIQYVPIVMDLGLDFLGAEAEHAFLDRFIEAALAYASCGIISGVSKQAFHSLRPNGANYQSFPSGHTDTAFTAAELVRREYGWGWGAGAYGIAATVAGMRLYRNWHWLGDVLAGAGVGILSANIGCWLLEPTKNLLGMNKREELSVYPTVDPVSGTVCTALAFRF